MSKTIKFLVVLCCFGLFCTIVGCAGGGGIDEAVGANVVSVEDEPIVTELRSNSVSMLYPTASILSGQETLVILSFSEPIVDLTANELKRFITIKKKNGNSFQLIAESYELVGNRVVNIYLKNLEFSTEYEILVEAGIKAKNSERVKDSEAGSFVFTTSNIDKPRAALFYPAVSQYDILPVDGKLSVAFTMNMKDNAKYSVKLISEEGVEVPLDYSWTFERKLLDVVPAQPLAYDSAYSLVIDKELAISDTGLSIDDFVPINLETIGIAKASLIEPNGLTGVSVYTNRFLICFDEEIDWTLFDNTKIILETYRDDVNQWVIISNEPGMTVEQGEREYSFNFSSSYDPYEPPYNIRATPMPEPSSPYLTYETKFKITVKEGIKTKSYKKPYVEPIVWEFETEADTGMR